jgi:hypothetical protein
MYDMQNSFTYNESTGAVYQAPTATAASTNVIDWGTDGLVLSKPLYLHFRVIQTFTADGAATMGVLLQSHEDADFGSGLATLATLYETSEGKATFVAGLHKVIPLPVQNFERFMRLYFTIGTGPMTAGKVVAYINDSPEI